jgi:hypothetical protein
MSEELIGSKSTASMAGCAGTISVLDLMDAELQAIVRDLDHAMEMAPPDQVGATIERLIALASSRLSPETSWRSRWLWALRKPSRTDAAGERGKAIRLCHGRPEMFYEIPAASGVFDLDGRANTRANVDLAVEVEQGEHYVLVELKEKADDPAFAAAEILRNFILYMLARRYGPPELIEQRSVLQARRIELQVWAPGEYYEGHDWTNLERNLSEGLCRWVVEKRKTRGDVSIEVSFSFNALGKDGRAEQVASGRTPMP